MTTIIVDTEQFWRAMCRPGFVRLSPCTGAVGNNLYFTESPPSPEFIACVVDRIKCDLQIDRPHPIGDFLLSISIPLMWSALLAIYGVFLRLLWI